MVRKGALVALGLVAVASLTACSGGGASDADDYPEGDIDFIVPYPAGSGPDAAARVITDGLEKELGVGVTVENIEGGSSTAGLFELSRAEPDGYTLGWGTVSGISVQSRLIENPFEGIESLTPISRVNLVANVLFTSPDKGWETVDDMIAAAKERPGELSVGLGNPGSIQDIQVRLLEQSAGIELKHVYFDAGQMILPAANGTVDMSVAQVAPTQQYEEAGDVVYVGVLGDTVPEGIEAPLIDDSGHNTAESGGWEGLFGPAGMDEEIAGTISDAVGRVMESDEYIEYVRSVYAVAGYQGHEEFSKTAVEDDASGQDIIDRFDLKSE